MERPAENLGLLIKLRLAVACAANVVVANAREDLRVASEAWLRVYDVEDWLRKHHAPDDG